MRSTERVVAAIAALTVAGCGQGEPAAPPAPVEPTAPPVTVAAVAYDCEGGETIAIQYPDAQRALVTYQGRVYPVRAVEAASGARYSGSGIQWWTASRDGLETGTLGRISETDGGVSAILERCSRALPPAPGVPAAPIPCRSDGLRLEVGEGDAGAGSRGVALSLVNTGSSPCVIQDRPEIVLLDRAGDPLPDQTVRPDPSAPSAVVPVTLAAGGRATIDLRWSVVPDESSGSPEACPEVAAVRLVPNGEIRGLETPLTLTPCGGRVRVGPLRAESRQVEQT